MIQTLIPSTTIRLRLILAFVVLLGLAVVEGIWSLSYVGVMHDRLEQMYSEQLLAIKVLDEQRSTLSRIDRTVLRMRDAAGAKETLANDVESQLASMDKLVGEYRKSEFTAVEQKLVDGFKAAFASYAGNVRGYLGSVRDGNSAAVQTSSWASLTEPFQKADGRLGDLIDLNKNNARTHYEYAKVEYDRLYKLIIGIIAAFFVVGAALAYLIIRSISMRLNAAVALAGRVATGDLSAAIDVGREDEVGHLLRSMRKMIDGLINMVQKVRRSTDAITHATREVAQGSHDLSQRTEEQATSVEETAATVEELTSTSKQNTENTRSAAVFVGETKERAVQSVEAADRLTQCMAAINNGAARISEITGVIDEIAFQTNILALNAAIEAARAGQQGRGFVVVANEVRALAQRSAAQAKGIKELIRSSISEVDAGKRHVSEVRTAIDDIAASIERLNETVTHIAMASSEQTNGIEQISVAVSQSDDNTQRNAALVEQSAAASTALNDQAQQLNELMQMFKLPTDQASRPAAEAAEQDRNTPEPSDRVVETTTRLVAIGGRRGG